MRILIIALFVLAGLTGLAETFVVGQSLDVAKIEREDKNCQLGLVTHHQSGIKYWSFRKIVGNAEIYVYVSQHGKVLGVTEERHYSSLQAMSNAVNEVKLTLEKRYEQQLKRREVTLSVTADEKSHTIESICLAREFAEKAGMGFRGSETNAANLSGSRQP